MGGRSGEVIDALGRAVSIGRTRRVVSLVPSETESVAVLGGRDILVGRTDFCIEPEDIASVPSVGGTKKFDVEAVLDLRPDLVLANQEENSKSQVERLIASGLRVHVSFPQTVEESFAYLDVLARLLGVDPASTKQEAKQVLSCSPPTVRAFVPIWKDPWMTFNQHTYASDVLRLCGAINVFGSRDRRYPLAADLDRHSASVPTDRDTRYPRTTLAEVAARSPERVLLPDEPYRFTEEDKAELSQKLPTASIEFVDGKDLFWYGARAGEAVLRLRLRLASQER